ncbi:transglycosylase domain-containing protein [Actinomadura namibiensis]|uniref:Membrane peptidoglycan carboxypeptidase n=1 Tax=Actinomadura namibiensis TaxID=182080 RepID=A0A7W3QKK7_ACTNM|nr:transglycosylase domain-containing protein [Actinomadura namibiensis]MBA8950515.1 membrane peptidoglycan carboxypeptidase [Actinomadura namibiensis]
MRHLRSRDTGWRRFLPSWKVVLGTTLLGGASVAAMVGVAYANTPVPKQPTVQGVEDEASIFYYADGKTEIGRIGKRREIIDKLDKIPPHVQDAVLAAENRSFWSDKGGISIKGTSRAVWLNLTGGRGGGSTITQQLAKNYYSNPLDRSYSRKVKELFISMKLEEESSKEEILRLYLNTVSFGRDTYGIQAAAREFFDKNVGKLTVEEAAVLAGAIQDPNRDIAKKQNRDWVTGRYRYVLNGLVEMKKLDKARADQMGQRLPRILTVNAHSPVYAGHKGYMLMRAKEELRRMGIKETELTTDGLRVYTTFDKKKMDLAKAAAERGVPQINAVQLAKRKIRVGLVSVNNANGEVEAFYGGPDYLKYAFDNVWSGSAQAGSAMKPYVLATALKQGYSLRSMVEGRSRIPLNFNGDVVPVGTPGAIKVPNGHSAGPAVNLIDATADSTNTAYVQLGLKVRLQNVVKTATDAGVSPDMLKPFAAQAGLSLGINNIRPIEQAAGYQAFANGGTYHKPHVIRRVMTKDNKPHQKKYRHETRKVFDAGVAADATYAMQQVVRRGTGTSAALPDGRPVAGKTGTTDRNVATWFVGYIPQVSTAVTMYSDKVDPVTKLKRPLILDGHGEIEGGSGPAKIWRAYMAEATDGMEIKQFPPPVFGGRTELWAKPPKKKEKKEEKKEEDKDRPEWCNLPWLKDHPRCKGEGGQPDDQNKPPCQSPVANDSCDPNKPPSRKPPFWWCASHPEHPWCRRGGGGGGGRDQDDNGLIFPNSAGRVPLVVSPGRPRT